MARSCWLMKSEPGAYSFGDLMGEKDRTACWDGVRNYQARNLMREMKKGDRVIFYHSGARPPHAAGVAEVARTAYPDPTQFDPCSRYFDPRSDPENPRWEMVDVRAIAPLARPVPLAEMRANPRLEGMALLQKGQRLSVQPLTKEEFDEVVRMGKGKKQ